jgi:Zinc knuckle
MPQDQWKEELHDKLYNNLRVQMEVKVADEDCSFHAYCKTAQQYARGLKQTGKERSDRRAAQAVKRAFTRGAKETNRNPPSRQSLAPAPAVKAPDTCYNCGKLGHYANNYPAPKKTEAKVINRTEEYEIATDLAESENEQL